MTRYATDPVDDWLHSDGCEPDIPTIRARLFALESEIATLVEEAKEAAQMFNAEERRANEAEAKLDALTRPPSDEEVGKAEKEAARSVRFQLGGPFAVGLSEKERIEFDAKAARLAKVAAAPFTDLIRRLTQANKTLPDWNTLSNEARDAMKEAAGFHVSDVWAAQCALDVYNAGRRALSTHDTKKPGATG